MGILLVLFAVVFFSQDNATQTFPRKLLLPEIANKSIASLIYRYDASEKTYVPETSEGWQNKDFVRYIFDVSEVSPIAQCNYFVYDAVGEKTKVFSTRKCNAPITITVGERGVCSSQGKDSCIFYVYATDEEGRGGEFGIESYSIDYEPPLVGKVFAQENQTYPIMVEQSQQVNYTTFVSDNIEVFGCWLYGGRQLIGPMQFSPSPCGEKHLCEAVATYAMPEGKEKQMLSARCADQYDVVDGRYLNIGYGRTVEIMVSQNHPPQITFCRVAPAQGTIGTLFAFEVQAHDPDKQELEYAWEFGDGIVLKQQESQHYFLREGTYSPKVTVRDNAGEEKECFTAWVVIQ